MMELLSQITISEVILLFILLFVLPGFWWILSKLKKYESLFGQLPEEKKGKGKGKKDKKPEPEPAAAAAATAEADAVPADVYPYKSKAFLSPAERSCLTGLREALGPDVDVFPKVALWETVESTDKNPGFAARLHGRDYDFLVCDTKTGAALAAIMFKPGKGRPAGPVDELKKICEAAGGAGVALIDMAEQYDAKKLKDALGIPEL